ncbi:hypothetical protein [Streptomyces sp. NPDC055299]
MTDSTRTAAMAGDRQGERMSTPTSAPTTHSCPECVDLERGRKQAAAARDLSRVTDFHVLIARHRARHGAES